MDLNCREARLEARLQRAEQSLESRLKQMESTLMWRMESRLIGLAYVLVMMVVFGVIIWTVR